MSKAKRLYSIILAALLFATMAGGSSLAQSGSRYFPETGHNVSGRFLQYWQEHGGLEQQGYPRTEEFQEVSEANGQTYTVQYFERAVFELHPENSPPNDVLLSRLGSILYKRKYPNGAPGQVPNTSNPRLFPETGKTLGGVFRTYWETHGGLAQQGLPISEEFAEVSELNGQTYIVQYFERAVFELHPENQPPNNVLLSQVGRTELLRRYPNNSNPAAAPATPQAAAPQPTQAAGNRVSAQVVRVVDGDTIVVSIAGQQATVRYIGVDTPETVNPNSPVECYGAEASAYNKKLVEGKTVQLEKDVSETDRFGRLLRYVYVDGLFVNAELVKGGYAQVSTFPPDVKYQEQFISLERVARAAGLGLWGTVCRPTATATSAPAPPTGTTAPLPAPSTPTTPPSGGGGVCGTPYSPTGPDRDCGDFTSQRQAQCFFEAAGGPGRDPHRLDGDNDGIACESLP